LFALGLLWGLAIEFRSETLLYLLAPCWLVAIAIPIRWLVMVWRLPLRTGMALFQLGWLGMSLSLLLGNLLGRGHFIPDIIDFFPTLWSTVALPGAIILAIPDRRDRGDDVGQLWRQLTSFRLRHLLIAMVALAMLFAAARIPRGHDDVSSLGFYSSGRTKRFYLEAADVMHPWLVDQGYERVDQGYERVDFGAGLPQSWTIDVTTRWYAKENPDGTKVYVHVECSSGSLEANVETKVSRQLFPESDNPLAEFHRIDLELRDWWQAYLKANGCP